MKILSLVTTFSGRIGRAQWWLGWAIIILAGLIALLSMPDSLDTDVPLVVFDLAGYATALMLFWMSMAITFKRLQDRDWPQWVAPAVAVLNAPRFFGPFFGMFSDFEAMASGTGPLFETVYFWLTVVIGAAIFIDNGFLEGTRGPNRYGPDPLSPTG